MGYPKLLEDNLEDLEDTKARMKFDRQYPISFVCLSDEAVLEIAASLGGYKMPRFEQIVFRDKVLRCRTCGKEFFYSAKKQRMFASKEWKAPKRCKECRRKKTNPSQPGDDLMMAVIKALSEG